MTPLKQCSNKVDVSNYRQPYHMTFNIEKKQHIVGYERPDIQNMKQFN